MFWFPLGILMILVMSDGINLPWFFPRVVRKIPPEDILVVYIPSHDYRDKNGIHYAPGLAKLLLSLAKKRFRDSYSMHRILSYLGLTDVHATDFEFAVNFFITHWLSTKGRVRDLIDNLARGLGIKHRVVPVVDPLSTTKFRDDKGNLIMETPSYEIDLKDIEFEFSKNTSVPDTVINALKESDKILIVGSALSLLFLRKLEGIFQMIQEFRGQVIYVLPHELSPLDRAVLRNIDKEPSFVGLTSILNGNVDAIVVNSDRMQELQNINELHFMFYPISFDDETSEKRRKTIETFLKILES